MRMALLALAAGTLFAGAAQATDSPNVTTVSKDAVARERPLASKILYVCDQEELSWRAFSRDLGTPEFVTARQVIADRGKPWSAPKCITAAELRRLNVAKLSPSK